MECFTFTPNTAAMNICFLAQCRPNQLPKLLLLGRLEFPPDTDTRGNINLIATSCS